MNFNREVLAEAGNYFATPSDVSRLALGAEADPQAALARGRVGLARASRYDWDSVTDSYEQLCQDLQQRSVRATGRRRRSAGQRRAATPVARDTQGAK